MISDERLNELILMSEETVNTLPDGCEVHLIMDNERDELDALYELLDARQKIDKLIANSERLAGKLKMMYLIITSSLGGTDKPVEDALNSHADLMPEVKK